MSDYEIGTLEFYLNPRTYSWREKETSLPHEVVAWRKLRGKYWTSWSYYSRYSWANIRKWVTKRGDVYQIATASGQLVTVKRCSGGGGMSLKQEALELLRKAQIARRLDNPAIPGSAVSRPRHPSAADICRVLGARQDRPFPVALPLVCHPAN